MADQTEVQLPWGRVLIAGGTNWATNGRKDRPPTAMSDLLSPHILRSMCNIKVTKLITGPAANYAVVIDVHGAVHLFGRSPAFALGANTMGVISEHAPLKLTPSDVGLPRGAKFIGGAAGRTHILLVDSLGGVWGCGNNVVGQIGLPTCFEVEEFTKVTGGWPSDTKIVQVTAGNTFSLFLSDQGQIFASGSSESGQLGNGKTGERILKGGKIGFDIEVPPKMVQGLKGKKITEIASGNQHSLAIDEEGYVWAWGFAGYSRLGLQDQKDRLVPTLVGGFAAKSEAQRARSVLCGPTSSVVIDRTNTFYIAGKWKLTGDGSTGQPYTYFKTIQDIASVSVIKASCGGCTHFLTSAEDDGIMTVGFGQGVLYGELGLGSEAKSATKPTRIEPLDGVEVIDVAAGSFFTLFLARPNAQLSDVPRYPEHIDSASVCVVCDNDRGEDDPPMECEKCDQPYHIDCLDPPLSAWPDGEWFCPDCEKEEEEDLEQYDEEPTKVEPPAVLPTAPTIPSIETNATIGSDVAKETNGNSGTDGAEVKENGFSAKDAITPQSQPGQKRPRSDSASSDPLRLGPSSINGYRP